MKESLLYSWSDEQNGSPKSAASYWWRRAGDFDEDGHFKVDVSNPSNLTPRLKLLTEMERLAFDAAHGLNGLRHKILSYKAGDFCLPVGGIQKQDMDIPPAITILLTGLASSGKTSFINLMYGVLGRFGLAPFAQTSGESSNLATLCLEEHNVLRSARSGFCVFDTRGLDQNRMEEGGEEVSAWMADGVRHLQPCYRAGDENVEGLTEMEESMELASSRYMNRKVNFVMVVADLSQIHMAFKSGDLKPVVALRDLFHLPAIKSNISSSGGNGKPTLILTHGDTLSCEDRMNGRVQICEYLGIPEAGGGVYDIACKREDEETDPVSAYALTEAVYRALVESDRCHTPKWKLKDWLVFIFSFLMCCTASLFGFLAKLFQRLAPRGGRVRRM